MVWVFSNYCEWTSLCSGEFRLGQLQSLGQQLLGMRCCSVRSMWIHEFYSPSMPVSNSGSLHFKVTLSVGGRLCLLYLPSTQNWNGLLYVNFSFGGRRNQVPSLQFSLFFKTDLNRKNILALVQTTDPSWPCTFEARMKRLILDSKFA